MLVKNSDITSAKGALAGVMGMKIPVKNSLEIARLDIKLNEPLEAFTKVRDSLYEKHQIIKEPAVDGSVRFTAEDPENLKAFVAEFNELLSQEVEVDCKPITLPDIEIEPAVLQAMMKFIK